MTKTRAKAKAVEPLESAQKKYDQLHRDITLIWAGVSAATEKGTFEDQATATALAIHQMWCSNWSHSRWTRFLVTNGSQIYEADHQAIAASLAKELAKGEGE